MEHAGFAEANRVVAGYGAAMPPVEIGNYYREWWGCRVTTQAGRACSAMCFPESDDCGRHRKGRASAFPPRPVEDTSEPIYFVAGGGLIKIGKGKLARAKSHQTGSPVKLTVLRTLEAQGGAEKSLHWMFAKDRVRG
jgi:hypothetical protein